MQRDDVAKLLRDVRPAFGFQSARMEALCRLMELTRPGDWTDPGVEPVCYMQQSQCADICNKTPRSLRDDEAAWVKARLVTKTTAANGSRGCFYGGSLKQGICFSPLIAMVPTLIAMKKQMDARRAERTLLRRKISAARRIFKTALFELISLAPDHPEVKGLLQELSDLPRRYDVLSIGELSQLLESVDKCAHHALHLVDLQSKITDQSAYRHRPHIQDTKEDLSVICNGSPVDMQPSRKRDDGNPSEVAPAGTPSCRENNDGGGSRGHKPELLESFKPRQVYAACSDNMRLYLDTVKGDRALPDALDFIRAAELMLRELGINQSAWDDACNAMGPIEAALSVIVIDAGQYRSSRPIHSPGGALRAFTRRHKAGQLNLTGSIIGMIERSREK
ncbi:replication initiation protein RepC [Cereibacter changlensis]|uniref:Replication initiation protein RepC n=5 Tax=Cereibacter changlensis TaxID=402884 RepID=A0A2W7QFC7_9RHOB|nr:replication initiation protein RepC [Cereibacter changlensis]